MTLQWSAVAAFLYVEAAVLCLLCLPFISAKRWSSIFHCRIWDRLAWLWNRVFLTMIIVLIILFIDAVREVRKYSDKDSNAEASRFPNRSDHLHMKLFRAQRNLYISGFAVFLWLVMRRMITLINQLASTSSSTATLQLQADSANKAAQKYLEDNELLKQALVEGDGDGVSAEAVKHLREELKKLREELSATKDALKNSESEAESMKKQSDGIAREYDRLLKEHQELQNLHDGGDKKDD